MASPDEQMVDWAGELLSQAKGASDQIFESDGDSRGKKKRELTIKDIGKRLSND